MLKFVTTNKHKYLEVKTVFDEFDIELEQLNLEYPEDKEKEMKEISLEAAKYLSEKLDEAVVVEDTGLYFEAYKNFPGAQPKFVYNSLGFKGIFKLLDGFSRKAYFKSVFAYCEPGFRAISFEGVMNGTIAEKIYSKNKDAMPYDHIFIPSGFKKAIVDMSIEEKNSFSQRAKAAKELAKYLKNK